MSKKEVGRTWDSPQELTFEETKLRLTIYPVRRHLDPGKPVESHTDCSGVGCLAVLVQKHEKDEHTITYSSKTLSRAQRNYGATGLEFWAVIHGVEKYQA